MLRVSMQSTVLRLALVAAVAALAFLAGNFYTARAIPTPTTFYACLDTNNGNLSAVSTIAQAACKKNATAVSWSQIGPQGPQGPQGEKGDTGPAGTVVASSCNAGDVVTGVGADGTAQCTDPGSYAFRCSISHLYLGMNLAGCDLSRANLLGANLTGADLTIANLTLAKLNAAFLTNATLYDASLYGVNLTLAKLDGADLTSANLTSADLTDANLTYANLTGAYLNGATTTGAIVTRVTWSFTTCPDGSLSNDDGGTCVGHGF